MKTSIRKTQRNRSHAAGVALSLIVAVGVSVVAAGDTVDVLSTVADWDTFAAAVNSGTDSYSDRTVTLAADIGPVATCVGTPDHPFRGTFDGNGHILTVAIESTEPFAAPFSRIDGATISNLVVAGTVESTGYHAAGLVGGCGVTAPNAIRDCIVSVAVDGAPYAGGIVGHGGQGELTLEGCVFDGSVSGFTTWAGGLMGWCDALTLDIRDCLVTGAFTPGDGGQYHPIACKFANRDVAATVTRAYYLHTLVPTATGNNLIPGAGGTPVSETYVAGEWPYPVRAADGNVYFLSEPDGDNPEFVGIITSTVDWDAFADIVNSGTDTYEGKTVTLIDDIFAVTNTVGTIEHPFRGTFDGGGHKMIVHLLNNMKDSFVAPFSVIDGATISNLAVDGAVMGGSHAAGLVGFCGTNGPNTVVDCAVATSVAGKSCPGGIVGHGGAGELRMERCVFSGIVGNFMDWSGGLMGWCDALTLDIRNCLVTSVAFQPSPGGKFHPIACKNPTSAVAATADSAYYLNTITPTATGDCLIPGAEGIPVSATSVPGAWETPVTAADGAIYYLSSSDFVIASVADWDAIAARVNDGTESFDGRNVTLLDDIAVSTPMGTPEHPFRGTFDGNGHTLTLDLSGSDPFIAPFRRIDGATIMDLLVAGSVESTGDCAAGLVGSATGTNAILNCTVSATIQGVPCAGGLVGRADGGPLRVENSVFSGTLSGFTARAGGLLGGCGDLSLTLLNCLVKGLFAPGNGGKFHPVACKDADATVDATIALVGYLETLAPTETAPYLIPGADGIPLRETDVPGETLATFPAPDGITYFIAPDIEIIILQDGETFSGTIGENTRLLVAADATVTLSNATVTAISHYEGYRWAGIDCMGDAAIVLASGTINTVTGCTNCPGIHVPSGKTLVIRGSGALDARGGGDFAAGIGGGATSTATEESGNIVIEDGTITATGGKYAAGIGTGHADGGRTGGISISGGTVTATSGKSGAAIGSGRATTCGGISISDGTVVTATLGGSGIGSGSEGSCGDISISGGTVVTSPGDTGIGAGQEASCGDISISGGTVTVSYALVGAAIGSGKNASCGDISIAGGTVTALADFQNAAIGSGYGGTCGDIEITDGVTSVTAEVQNEAGTPKRNSPYSVGAGSSDESVSSTCGTVTIAGVASGGIAQSKFFYAPTGQYHVVRFDANDGSGRTAAQFFPAGTRQVLAANPFFRTRHDFLGWDTAATGGGVAHAAREIIDDPGDITFYAQWNLILIAPEIGKFVPFEGEILTGTGGAGTYVLLPPGATVTMSNLDLTATSINCSPVICQGDATIILADGTTNAVAAGTNNCAGIRIGPTNTTLVIRGGGSLTATGWEYGAGIGGDFSAHSFGNIVIKGGTITAGVDGAERTSCHGAGIGSGGGGELVCGDISILGGTIVATGGYRGGAGIGSGESGICGYINILGGTVTATGGEGGGAGIGTGVNGGSDDITIGSNIVSVVAKSLYSQAEPIGAGKGGSHANNGVKRTDQVIIVYVARNLVDQLGYSTRTITNPSPPVDYATWAAETGIAGAWNEKDADGIANVFRYVFDVAEGTDDLRILDVTFDEQGRAVVQTPRVANSVGFDLSIATADDPAGGQNAASYPLDTDGETVIDEPDTGSRTRFYRLKAKPDGGGAAAAK